MAQDLPYLQNNTSTIEFEHIYPMARLKTKLLHIPRYRALITAYCPSKKRSCLRSHLPVFSAFEGDIIHIRPVIKQLNRHRATKWFFLEKITTKDVTTKRYHCQISFSKKHFYPPHAIKGDIARMMLLLEHKYKMLPLFSKEEITIFQNWAFMDPYHQEEHKTMAMILTAQQEKIPLHLEPFFRLP